MLNRDFTLILLDITISFRFRISVMKWHYKWLRSGIHKNKQIICLASFIHRIDDSKLSIKVVI